MIRDMDEDNTPEPLADAGRNRGEALLYWSVHIAAALMVAVLLVLLFLGLVALALVGVQASGVPA